MKNLLLLLISVVFFMLTSEKLFASKIMGSDFTWSCVGKDSFLVKLVVYKDCNGVSMGTASFTVKCVTSGTTLTTFAITKPTPIEITPTCATSCTRCKSSGCSFPYGIEQYTYSSLLVLNNTIAGSCCKINMSFSMCCRSASITTGAASQNFYTYASFDRCLSPCDNSPTFTNPPISIICVGQDFQYSNGVLDFDLDSNGALFDSLTYELESPLELGTTPSNWASTYGYDKPVYFWGFPNSALPFPRGFHLDKATGEIAFRPMKVESTIMAVKVNEWRNINGTRIKIGEVRRDYQIIIISCPSNHPPVLSGSYYAEVCAGDTLKLSIKTNDYEYADTLTIGWNNAIKGATWTDNNGTTKHPTGTFIWVPDSSKASSLPYIFTVNVKDNSCPAVGKQSRDFQIIVKPQIKKLKPAFSVIDTGCGLFYFSVNNPLSSVSYKWNGLYPYEISGKSTTQTYKNAGKYPFTLTGTLNGCVAYFTLDTLDVKTSNLIVKLPSDTILKSGDSISISPVFLNTSGKVKFKWFNGDTISNPLILKNLTNDINIKIEAEDAQKCPNKDSMFIDVRVLTVNAGKDQYNCPGNNVTFYSTYGPGLKTTSVMYYWFKLGSSTTIGINSSISLKDSGTYICQVVDNIGDKAYDTVQLRTYSVPKVDAGQDTTLCSLNGLFLLKGSPSNYYNYWTGTGVSKIGNDYFFDAKSSSLTNGGLYTMKYNFTDSNSCYLTDSKDIRLYFSPYKPNAGIYPVLCFSQTPLQLTPSPINGTWYGKGLNSSGTEFNPEAAGEGKHMLVYEVYYNVCVNSDTTFITVLDSIDPVINTFNKKKEYCIGFGNVELKNYPIFGGFWTGPPNTIVNKKYFNTNQKPGVYILTFEIRDSMNCPYYKDLELTVVETSIAIDKKDLVICENEDLQLFADAQHTSGLLWTKGSLSDGTFLSSDINSTINYKPGKNDLANKKFWLFVTTTDPICINKKDSALIKISTIVPDFDYSPTTYSTVPVDVAFTDLSTTTNSSIDGWNWDFGNGNKTNVKNPVTTYFAFGKYKVRLIAINSEECNDTITKELDIASSIEDALSSSLFIIPNPATEQVIIKSENSKIEFIRLINGMGQIIISDQNIENEQYQLINNSGLKGIYLLQTGLQGGRVVNSKIIFE